MRIYRSVCTYIWNDDKFPFASDDCQLVWFHMFTHPASTPLGILRASLAGLAEDKNRNGGWTLSRYTKAFEEALGYGFVKVDRKALLISFPKYFSPANTCNHPQSPNVVTSWGERFHDLPNSPLKTECYQSLKALLEGFGEGFRKAFSKAFGEGSPNTDSLFLIPEPEPYKEKTLVLSAHDNHLSSLESEFEQFWKAYPRKKAKDKARERWKKTASKRPPLEKLLAAIERAKATEDWKKDNGQFIPYPASWLNGGCWDDECITVEKKKSPMFEMLKGKVFD